jgi:hypothetical protein
MNVARIRYTLGSGTFTTIGKIYAGKVYYYIPGGTTETVVAADVEVLACQKCSNGGSGVYCCVNGKNKI